MNRWAASQRIHHMKPQTLSLIEHLNSGGSVTRESAWQDFRIQNITARISELSALGYCIVKTLRKALMDGRKIRLTTWKLREAINKGDHVKILVDNGTLVPLKGRTGTVDKVFFRSASATVFIPNVGHRLVKLCDVKRIHHLLPGTRAAIRPVPYVVTEYHPNVDSYTLTSANPEHTIVASAALVVEAPVVTLH